jgi:phosphatidylinositol alpha-1,6-mannosyltransferase
MKIAIVSQNYHPFVGGVETHARQVARELAKDNQVTVAAVRFGPSTTPRRLAMLEDNLLVSRYPSYQDERVQVVSLSPTAMDRLRLVPLAMRATPKLQRYAYHGLNRWTYRAYRGVFLPKLRKVAADADVIHSLAFGQLGWAAQEAAAERGIPFVCTPFVHPQQWGDGPDDVAYYKRADALIALVETDKQYLTSLGIPAEKIRVIGVSPELPPESDAAGFRKRHGLGDWPLVLYVGRMMRQKGAGAVIAATEKVWAKRPDTRFVFIGPASPAEAGQFAGRDPRLQYLGKVSFQQKADALAACDIFCMPSMSEILPTVYLEAWSFGKPVVGGLAHGLRELVEGNGGGISSSQETDELAGALLRLLDHPAERQAMGANGKRLVETTYSVPAVSRSLLSLYQEVAGVTANPVNPMIQPISSGA